MPPITLAQAKAFLRVTDEAEDAVLQLLLDAALERVQTASGRTVDETSPAALRVCVLLIAAHAFENREGGEAPGGLVEPWLAPFREARL